MGKDLFYTVGKDDNQLLFFFFFFPTKNAAMENLWYNRTIQKWILVKTVPTVSFTDTIINN